MSRNRYRGNVTYRLFRSKAPVLGATYGTNPTANFDLQSLQLVDTVLNLLMQGKN